jgi:hypothetical protein
MTDTTQPGDGLPPSEPTQDIGAEPLPLTGAAVKLALREIAGDAALWDEVRRGLATVVLESYGPIFGVTLNAGHGYEADCDTDGFIALTNLTGDEPVTVVRVDTTDYRAERDALAAQLARVQAVIDGLPSEPRNIDRLVTLIEAVELDRAYLQGRYEVRQALREALKGEAK